MKRTFIALAVVTILSACSTTNSVNSSAPIREQKLSTNFTGEKVKIETKCEWMGMSKDCQIIAIESTGTANTFGGTANNRKQGFIKAEMRANSNIAEFMAKQVTTERVQSTIAKNIEKANDKIRSGKNDGETVEMSDTEAKNVSLRENANDTAVTLTETIRTNSQAILRGFIKVKEEVVGDQEVAVTIRWDKDSEKAAELLHQKFSQ